MYWTLGTLQKVILYLKVLSSESPKWPQVWFTGNTHRTQQKDAKWTQQRERHKGWSLEEARLKLPAVFFQWSHIGDAWFLLQGVITTCMKCPLLGQLTWTRMSRVRIDVNLYAPSASVSMYQNFRRSEGKQRLVVNRIVCTSSTDTVCHPFQSGSGGHCPESQVTSC